MAEPSGLNRLAMCTTEEKATQLLSFGPWPQRAALTRLAALAADLYSGGALPAGVRALT
jgi:hypothetical protein